jgi:hypothetical protein
MLPYLRWGTTCLLFSFFVFGAAALGADEPVKKDKSMPDIDFSKLPAATDCKNYSVRIKVEAKDGTVTKETYNIAAGTSPQTVRDLVKASLQPAGWDVAEGKSPTALIIKAYGKTGSPVVAIEAVSKELPKENQPQVRNIPG